MTAEFIFWDVDHGHATYLRTPNGRHLVADLGVGSYHRRNGVFSPLTYLRTAVGVTQLDWAVITHPHKDHIDDIEALRMLEPRVLLRPNHLTRDEVMKDVRAEDARLFEAYFALSDSYSEAVADGGQNDPSDGSNWGGMTFRAFLSTSCARSNINNHSIVVVAEYLGLRVVVPGDNESCSLADLLGQEAFTHAVGNADVLLAPHHGREAGFYLDFVKLVNPRLTVISDGAYGDTSATARYSALTRGWTVHRRSGGSEVRKCVTTRTDGDISIKVGPGAQAPFLSVEID